MKITFVNKNYLIPDIKEFTSLEDSLDKLCDATFNQSVQYNENVYIVHCSKIYFRFNENQLPVVITSKRNILAFTLESQ